MSQQFKTQGPLLRAQSIRKVFHHPCRIQVLDGVDLTVSAGETVAISGRSGQGKSTLLQILGTLEDPCDGTIEIAGEKVGRYNKSRLRNEKLAFVFQSFYLLDDYTALDNVLMPACIARKSTSKSSEMYRRACSLLEHVGLENRREHRAKLLSGGEKQRVAIARALCNNPDLIFADEPSGNLDRESAAQIHRLLIDLAEKQNKAVIIVTHDPVLSQLCQSRYCLTDGHLLQMS